MRLCEILRDYRDFKKKNTLFKYHEYQKFKYIYSDEQSIDEINENSTNS